MIHAFLFLTSNNRDRDGHGPEFQFHMNRINRESGTKITVGLIWVNYSEQTSLFILYLADLPQLPWWSESVQDSLVEMQRPLPAPSSLPRASQTLHEPSSWTQRQLVGSPSGQLQRDVHQDQGARWFWCQKEAQRWEQLAWYLQTLNQGTKWITLIEMFCNFPSSRSQEAESWGAIRIPGHSGLFQPSRGQKAFHIVGSQRIVIFRRDDEEQGKLDRHGAIACHRSGATGAQPSQANPRRHRF